MKKLLLLVFLAGLSLKPFAQKLYFIYLQTENAEPFFIKMDEKITSANAAGYLLIPRLYDSTYHLTVGFNNGKWPEQQFNIPMNQKDHGFLLKDFGNKGWGLFDLQSMAVLMNTQGIAGNEIKKSVVDPASTGFTKILSKAADDPSLLEKSVEEKPIEKIVQKEPVLPASNTETVKTEPVADKKTDPASKPVVSPDKTQQAEKTTQPVAQSVMTEKMLTEKKEEEKPVQKAEIKEDKRVQQPDVLSKPVEKTEESATVVSKPAEIPTAEKTVTQESYTPSRVQKRSESSTTEGFGLVFTDEYSNGITDTIKVVIPNPKPVAKLDEKPQVKEQEKPVQELTEKPVIKPDEKLVQKEVRPVGKQEVKPAEEKKFLEFSPVTDSAKMASATNPVGTANKNCVAIATDADFLKLRRRMAASEGDDVMISEARKAFRSKCYSTMQIKNLGVLFLNQEGRYRFFDTAYPFVTDAENYGSLQSELKDEYYIGRFKAMIRN
jgi:hypothetical protein